MFSSFEFFAELRKLRSLIAKHYVELILFLCAQFRYTREKRLVVLCLFAQRLHQITAAAHLDTNCLDLVLNSIPKLRLVDLILQILGYIGLLGRLGVVDQTRVHFDDIS